MSRSARFVEHDATRLVDLDDLSILDDIDVDGCYVRLSLRLTPEERAQLNVPAIREKLAKRGALRVVQAIKVVRAGVTVQQGSSSTPMERGLGALRAWLRSSGEDDDVVSGALELLDECVRR